MENSKTILFDYKTGALSGTKLHEWVGCKIMSISAKLTSLYGNVGYSWLARGIKQVFPSKKLVEVQFSPDTKFSYPYGDLYWSRLADRSKAYSDDMQNFLLHIRHVDYCFIDCGANYGLFSALVSSKDYGEKTCVAIEADPRTYEHLKRNCEINNNRFQIFNRAIFSKSGETVQIFGQKHEARSILNEGNEGTAFGEVETIAPDDFLDLLKKENTTKSVLKLDVEGVEIDAVKGSLGLLEKDCLIYYEDHGSDKDHKISKYLKEELGLQIFAPDLDGKCRKIEDLKQLDSIKTVSRSGYDFLATNSSAWLEEIEKLKA